MKLMICKNKDGNGYYSKIQNDFNGKHTEKYLNLQIPKQNNLEYGLYDVDGFISCYEKKDGTTEFKFVVTNAVPVTKKQNKNTVYAKDIDVNDMFVNIEDNMLDD